MAHGPVERAEGAILRAEVRVVDIAVDDVGDDALGVPFPADRVGLHPDADQVVGPEQVQSFFASDHPLQDNTDPRPKREHTKAMSDLYTFYASLEAEAQIPANGILSRTLYNDDHVKVVLFGFAEGQELSAHTAPMAASLYFVRGEARLTLGEDGRDVKAGAFVHMPPQLQHGLVAQTPVVMLLSMYKQSRS
jgi:quercetin dioxygenase-like cupin family protein